MTQSFTDLVPEIETLTNAELDGKLEDAVAQSEHAEKLVCCFLAEVRERGAYRDFGFSNIYDYTAQRFGFKPRKTRYLILLGRKLKDLPRLRAALRAGEIGWCKASRVASVASKEDEAMWLDSALSLSVQELDRRIKDGTDELASTLHVWLTSDQRVIWENALEICRRVAGAEISPGEALEYMAAEFIATWGQRPDRIDDEKEESVAPTAVDEPPPPEPGPQPLLLPQTELALCTTEPRYEETRKVVLERDRWKCSYPGCNTRRELHVHHISFRSRGGGHEPWNCLVLCAFHHGLVHAGQVRVSGRAPFELEWTPPRLMREVLERRRNRPSIWVGELEVREFPSRTSA